MRSSIPIRMAVEDALSEVVLRRALASRPVRYEIGAVYSRGGFGYLKKQTVAFNNAARACPFVLLTDLDQHGCPPDLVRTWLSGRPKHDSFLFRVAVREVESWLLGDMVRLTSFLHLKNAPAIPAPEALLYPKQELLQLSLRSRVRRMREALARREKRAASSGAGLQRDPRKFCHGALEHRCCPVGLSQSGTTFFGLAPVGG